MIVSTAKYTVGDTTAVKVFDGRGRVRIRPDSYCLLGASTVSQSTGYCHYSTTGEGLSLEFVSDTELWALALAGLGPVTVYVLAVD